MSYKEKREICQVRRMTNLSCNGCRYVEDCNKTFNDSNTRQDIMFNYLAVTKGQRKDYNITLRKLDEIFLKAENPYDSFCLDDVQVLIEHGDENIYTMIKMLHELVEGLKKSKFKIYEIHY